MDKGDGGHEAIVASWLETAEDLSCDAVLDVFEAGMQRMLRRARPTLGAITLGAIVDRVLYTAVERYPFLAAVQVSDGSMAFDELRHALGTIAPEELAEGARFALVEFLTVLGSLTAEILTPALHAELLPHSDTHIISQPSTRKKT